MNADEIRELCACYDALEPRADELMDAFYRRLFEEHPEVRPMFPDDMGQQMRHFLAAFSISVANLDNPQTFQASLRRMGARHQEYGVTPEMYPWVREALVGAIADTGGESVTPEIQSGWREALDMISHVMLNGHT